ncbi:uncharacterized protein LOC120262487 [Dioscorea cayenensis subsp. rotundata]|uniref:Uncharacterized protein LOC120262487 n=1 Tax=Dioscorea cayennensis subsp. rotundata TaxID=55577 RepID=A0AB40BHH8_DIOCR|nr:uncharacterized protein LOC120262487 [Dioscorea cayenensis subsp. rotundata]
MHEIKKAKELSGASWDDATKTIILDPIVALTYIEAHPAARLFINKPIENYEVLKIICGEDSATGSYVTSLFSEFGERSKNEVNNNDDNVESAQAVNISDDDGDINPTPPIVSSPATSSTQRSQ